ncbi:MAG: AarF/ABC1/UbiB kinase family protein, partial [Burkholderiales bacterium]|nr:AarF/ABC1/UbiB kinase family protein [Burkholderiales bacterium]
MSKTSAPPSGKFRRTAIGSLALAQAGIAHLGHQARQLTRSGEAQQEARDAHETELGRILFRALNQLKGTALKLSQLLSMDADFLPEGMRRELAQACHQVTPLNRAHVHKVFRQEFAQAPEQMYAEFAAEAFAAASLGQVHNARLQDGTALAVKIQYPGIAASIGSDIRMLRGILHTLSLGSDLVPRPAVIDRVMQELEKQLTEEMDYEHEAAQLRWFRQRVDLPGIVIPDVIASHSGRRVLSMQRLDGQHLDDWLAGAPTQAQRDHFGQSLFDWFWYSLTQLGCLHADTHQGNFLFMEDGRLGVLDFGCTKTISPQFSAAMAQAWSELMLPASARQYDRVRLAYVSLGLISPELDLRTLEQQLMPAAMPLIDWQLEAYRYAHNGRFDFRRKSMYPAPDASDSKVLMQIAAGVHEDILYFDRTYFGLMHMLKKIGANVV